MTQEEKKEAKRLYDIEYRKTNKKKLKKQKKTWYSNNPDKVAESIEKNKVNKKANDKKYATKNREKLNTKKRKWAEANKLKVKIAKAKYVKKKMLEDPLFKFKHNISCGIRQSFKRNGFTKQSKTNTILGCSYEEFKNHIESLWESWMTWENYGKSKNKMIPNQTWDIDHIIPISSAKSEDDVIRLNHYTNLQPLCSYINQLVKKDNL